ncbi:uncharacterized protein LACBIDRAFT_253885 [Laccaria bicolor S238N-H82]|uniref:Predicted protein n=1 Tax=Laccaria bicolor (strain S238N-H82 / ATCC MYA-4686) TaxID=486041 RepID=B0DSI8_LACBS|nr:uncharacterized protein LACBIDRAFT_253885 [Laccaria bicolor S238N-H82]EDR02480.1 predicted protein [Laccaria bicolor S238N-H82]|eukprot:XP_001886843.1 predicted protein [Laccaria bicolor S238N-H82]
MADPTTQSNYLEIATDRINFEWNVDLETSVLGGNATHTLIVKQDGVSEVIPFCNLILNLGSRHRFDTRDLDVSFFKVGPKHPVMGSALEVPLPEGLIKDATISVKIAYSTTKDCEALQWLAKEQTQGKTFPYVFSQCQPIHARALAPLQDTPSVKIKYSAKVTSKLPVLISALRVSPPSNGPPHDGKVIGKDSVVYSYDQPIPIPSYLIAIAAGNIIYRPFPKYEGKTWSTGVWAEPELIDAAYWEFSEDTPRFLAELENIVTPYKFGVYDVLVLPPSFLYGGMENACLTFLTPTLLTGDRTLVDVVAHELSHSYFGNGVTHAHASHFWLNEGWTTYMERLLLQVVYSPAHRDFSFVIGANSLKDSLKEYEDRPEYQSLVITFERGADPDDAYSQVPYEKGANLILHLERTLGGLDVFLPYVRNYVDTFMGKSITTDQWKDHLYTYFEKNGGEEKVKALNTVDWQAWLYGGGLDLPVKMEYDLTLAKKAYELADRWDAARTTEDISKLNFTESDLQDVSSTQIFAFLERLQTFPPLPSLLVNHLGTVYKFSTSPNAEIRFRFYQVALADPSSVAAKAFADGSGVIKGRMKFCRPVFRAVRKVDADLAKRIFEPSKYAFHPIARKMIEKDLGIAEH